MAYQTKIGHVHLKVRNLEQAVEFYTRVLNFDVTDSYGGQYAFLSGGDMHHELALQQVGESAPGAPGWGVGLYHAAFEVPDRASFGAAVRGLQAMGVDVAVVEHVGISWAAYFSDPDGNGLEIYWDTREGDTSRKWLGNRPIPPGALAEGAG